MEKRDLKCLFALGCFPKIFLSDAQKVKNMGHAGCAQRHVGNAVQGLFCVVSYRKSCLTKHERIIGSVAYDYGLIENNAQVACGLVHKTRFFCSIYNLSRDMAAEHSVLYFQTI